VAPGTQGAKPIKGTVAAPAGTDDDPPPHPAIIKQAVKPTIAPVTLPIRRLFSEWKISIYDAKAFHADAVTQHAGSPTVYNRTSGEKLRFQ
jgi:hypothetical protein